MPTEQTPFTHVETKDTIAFHDACVARMAFGMRRAYLIDAVVRNLNPTNMDPEYGAPYWADQLMKLNDTEIRILGGRW